MAGWDKHQGGAVYAIPLGGTLIKVPFTIGELLVHKESKSRHPCCLSEPAGLLIGVPSACAPQGIPVSNSCTKSAACPELLDLLLPSVHENSPWAVQAALGRHTSWVCVTSCGGPT